MVVAGLGKSEMACLAASLAFVRQKVVPRYLRDVWELDPTSGRDVELAALRLTVALRENCHGRRDQHKEFVEGWDSIESPATLVALGALAAGGPALAREGAYEELASRVDRALEAGLGDREDLERFYPRATWRDTDGEFGVEAGAWLLDMHEKVVAAAQVEEVLERATEPVPARESARVDTGRRNVRAPNGTPNPPLDPNPSPASAPMPVVYLRSSDRRRKEDTKKGKVRGYIDHPSRQLAKGGIAVEWIDLLEQLGRGEPIETRDESDRLEGKLRRICKRAENEKWGIGIRKDGRIWRSDRFRVVLIDDPEAQRHEDCREVDRETRWRRSGRDR